MPRQTKKVPKKRKTAVKAKQRALLLPLFGYNLNPEQKAAVTHGGGPLLIVAGAGTGKTTVITERVAWLLREGRAKPEELLVLTFTEKAAQEMEERVDRLLPYGYVDILISTFHSFGERMLREFGLEIGLDTRFRVLSTAEQWLLLRHALSTLPLKHYKPLGNPTRFLHALLTHFSRAKDEMVSPKQYLEFARSLPKSDDEEREIAEKNLEVAECYKAYEKLLRDSGHLDYGDLILQTLRLVQERPSVAAELRKRFTYILVDEFQDTNFAQYELVKLLAQPANNLTVVGDDDQSIYKFRGASISNILEFKRDFPDSAEVSLIRNYRSAQNILDLAYMFIQRNNPNRLEAQLNDTILQGKGRPLANAISKKLKSSLREKGTIRLLEEPDADAEASAVVDDILKKKKSADTSWNDFAVLVRANSHADAFVRTLEQRSVPYQFVAARGLLQQPEVLDLLSYLKLLDNYHESAAMYRVLLMPLFQIRRRTIMDLLQMCRRTNVSLFAAAEDIRSVEGSETAEIAKVENVLALVRQHTEQAATKSAGQVLYQFLQDTNAIDRFDKDRDAEKIQNIAKFYTLVRDFEERNDDRSVGAFVQELSMMVEVGEDPAPSAISEGPESVKVMTVHGAKGLEFAHVFIPQCADKRFPTVEKHDAIPLPDALIREIIPIGDAHLEEERRLFYVAMTRAKSTLTFSVAGDYGGVRKKKPSRFLYELGFLKEVARTKYVQSNALLPRKLAGIPTRTKAEYPLPAKFSFTQLKAFETCPKQYWYAHILRIPVVGRYTFSFGKSMHAALQKFFAQLQGGTQPSVELLLRLYQESWIGEWFNDKRHEEEYRARGDESLRQFYEREQQSFTTLPLFVEKGFNVRIGEYTVKGTIDRVDPMAGKDGAVEILDYKTGSVPKNAKEGIDQLVVYAIAARDVLHLTPERATYYYLQEGERVSHEVTSEDMEKTQANILELINVIKQSTFKATPGFHCQFCDFKEICEDRAK